MNLPVRRFSIWLHFYGLSLLMFPLSTMWKRWDRLLGTSYKFRSESRHKTCYLTTNTHKTVSNYYDAAVPPAITPLDPTVPIIPGNYLSCSATGTPPIYTAIVLMRVPVVLVNTTSTAIIKLYERSNYSCVATSKYGTDTKVFSAKGKKRKKT